MNRPESLLIVGNSVRYLAQSASRGGYAVTGVDLFSDEDTQAACHTAVKTVRQDLEGLVDVCLGQDMVANTAWIYGAGFEAEPERLQQLESLGRCLGNSPRTLMLLSQPASFFPLLDDLAISYPRVSFRRPRKPCGWLRKVAGSYGGLGVRIAQTDAPDNRVHYFQRLIPGSVCSLTFLADGSEIEVLGINKLHAVNPGLGDFRFSGVYSRFNPGDGHRRQMIDMARKLTGSLHLRGANGIDCVFEGDQVLLLELNARPPATLELYEQALPEGGVVAHIAACNGTLSELSLEGQAQGYRVYYAEQDQRVGRVPWPDWCSDRPPAGTCCLKGTPVCGLHATGNSSIEVAGLLQERLEQIRSLVALSNQEAA